MIFLYILLAFVAGAGIKLAAFAWRLHRYGLDDPDPRGLRDRFGWFVDLVVEMGLVLAAYFILSRGQREGYAIATMYASVFLAAFSFVLVTRFHLSGFGRQSEFEQRVLIYSKLTESLVLAVLITGVAYPLYRWWHFS